MNIKEKGKSGIYTKVYGYVTKGVTYKQFKTEEASLDGKKKEKTTDYVQFDLVYETGSISESKPKTGSMRCQVRKDKVDEMGISIKPGDRLEVAGPLKVSFKSKKGQVVGEEKEGIQELGKTYISLSVAEISKD